MRKCAARDAMSFVEFDKHICAFRQIFKHPHRQPFVVRDEMRDGRFVKTALGWPRAFLFEPPSHHGVEVWYPQEDQLVQSLKEPGVVGRQRFVDIAPPATFGIRLGFKGIDRLIESICWLRPRADAPTLKQNYVGGCLHGSRLRRAIIQALVEDGNRYRAVDLERVHHGFTERDIVGTRRPARRQQGVYAPRQRFAFAPLEIEIVNGQGNHV